MMLRDVVISLYWKNRKTYRLSMNIFYGNILKKITSIILLFINTFRINKLNSDCNSEVEQVKAENDLFTIYDGTKFYLPQLDLANGQFIQNKIFLDENYFEYSTLEKIKQYIVPDSVIFDVGANIGNHSLYFTRVCKAKTVFAFEPCKSTFSILKKNIEINQLEDKIIPYNVACGDTDTKGEMIIRKDAGSNSVEPNECGTVQIIKIDNQIIKDKISFIKIDVEGFEYHVLCGMKKLLQRDNPSILIEIFDSNKAKVIELLQSMNYSLEMKNGIDYVFVPKGC